MKKYFKALIKIVKRDPLTQFELLKWISRFIFPTYRFKWPQLDWWENKEFTNYLVKFDEQDGMNTDRKWTLAQLLRLTQNIEGDTAECGVYKGASSYLICEHNSANPKILKHHFIFDSFEGLSEPMPVDKHHWHKGALSAPESTVEKALENYPDKTILKGWIPDRFDEVTDKIFSFIHIDVDLYQPTLDSFEFFYPKVNAGGIILCDDYGCTTCPGVTKAIDEYLQDKPEKMISLCSGGGFMIKGVATQN